VAVLAGSTLGAAAGLGAAAALGTMPPALRCGAGLLAFGLAYGAATAGLGHPEARRLLGALRRRPAATDA
jgi:hypothetical protein